MPWYKKRFDAFGWHTIIIDGHNPEEIVSALDKAKTLKTVPCAIICKTFKGHKFGPPVEDNMEYHGKPVGEHFNAVITHLQSQIKNQNV